MASGDEGLNSGMAALGNAASENEFLSGGGNLRESLFNSMIG